jgi:hypothetical protein
MMSFNQHGDYFLSIQGNVVVAEISGSWNLEAAEAYEQNFKKLLEPLLPCRWGHIVYLNDWDLGVAEIAPVIARLVSWCIENGLTRAANVFSESMIKAYVLETMLVDEVGDFQRKVFVNESEALLWLESFGYSLENMSIDETA